MLRFRVEEIEVLYENDDVQIIPFFPELNEPDVDLKKFVNRDFFVHPREEVMPSELHEVAPEEVACFLGIKPHLIGLATGHFEEECLQRVFTRKMAAGSAATKTEKEVLSNNKKHTLKTRYNAGHVFCGWNTRIQHPILYRYKEIISDSDQICCEVENCSNSDCNNAYNSQ